MYIFRVERLTLFGGIEFSLNETINWLCDKKY